MGQVSVYQYRDARGILLYVGITSQGLGRQLQHMAQSEWYRYYSTQSVEHYETREDAKARETWLIKNERPVFNRQENGGWEERRSAYLTLFDQDRVQVSARRAGCGHCARCRLGEDGCFLMTRRGPDDAAPYGTCPVCGSNRCLYAVGHEDGHIDGWRCLADAIYRLREAVSKADGAEDEIGGAMKQFMALGYEIYEAMRDPDIEERDPEFRTDMVVLRMMFRPDRAVGWPEASANVADGPPF